ncbi:DUF1338 domain-containing protein [Fulvivirgaceae bacterium BMA10]|uniref:2-oxoadipate dioxygenase/decarboxylase n=1 Tax=Splendidivirga corallicola TaxID=3051826 RepID=A0ABT8KIF5_9BACT|nr:DUF1338 domain-containing protein [Fulvivirgaceae bacterium BMA10]
MENQALLNLLWKDYVRYTPSAEKIHNFLKRLGEENICNDHVAFRTFDHPKVNIDQIAKIFKLSGYEEKGEYHFEEKKLRAKHYEHRFQKDAPKIFISELKLDYFSDWLKNVIYNCIDKIPHGIIESNSLVFSGRTWGTISHNIYEKLRDESEYCAWLYVYGFCANHFTIDINKLRNIQDLNVFNDLLEENGFKLNESGGKIKGDRESYLEQSSILADMQIIEFAEASFRVPSCYYEFAKRYPDASGNLYQGFIAKSADKIFESTDLVLQMN